MEAAIAIATKAAFDIMLADVAEGKLDLGLRILIKDETGDVVHIVQFRDLIEIKGATPS